MASDVSERGWTLPAAIAFVTGAALWWLVAAATGRREPWDASIYWTLAYPVALVTCAALGYFYPSRPWRWALALFGAQFVTLCLLNGEAGSLWPLGMTLFAALAAPGAVLARLAARRSLRSRLETPEP